MANQRQSKRRNLIYYLRVIDRNTRILLGRVVDITDEGMRLITDDPIIPHTRMKLQILLPKPINEVGEIDVNGECMWCEQDVNPDYYACGFHFDVLPEEEIDILKSLIYGYAFED